MLVDMLLTPCTINSGGGRKQTQDGSWVRVASTEVPGTLESWKNAMAQQQPVLIIIGMLRYNITRAGIKH